MDLLNIASTFMWLALAGYCTSVLYRLYHDKNDHQYLAITLMVILLSGLNICIGLFTMYVIPIKSEYAFLQDLLVGASIFQLLLCYCVIGRISKKSKNN